MATCCRHIRSCTPVTPSCGEDEPAEKRTIQGLHIADFTYTVTQQVTKRKAGVRLEIAIEERRLARSLNSEREMRKAYGERMAKVIARRLAVLRAAPNLAAVPTGKPERRHALKGKREGQQAVDLVHPRRLVFAPAHTPLPKRTDGGLDEERVTAISVIEVVDYH